MSKQEKFFDVYVSYPPNTDRERIHACLYDNLPENEVESLIQALAERPQAIVAEKMYPRRARKCAALLQLFGFGRDRPSVYGIGSGRRRTRVGSQHSRPYPMPRLHDDY